MTVRREQIPGTPLAQTAKYAFVTLLLRLWPEFSVVTAQLPSERSADGRRRRIENLLLE